MTEYYASLRQRGSTLFLTLIMLVVLTIISLATLGTSLMELRMSNNAEAGMAANANAQAVLDSVVYNGSNFLMTGNIGYKNCSANVSGCNNNAVAVPAPFDSGTEVVIVRLTDIDCPFRTTNQASSCTNSKAALFEISSKFDRSLFGQGKAEVNHGFVKLYPVSPGSGVDSGSSVVPLSN